MMGDQQQLSIAAESAESWDLKIEFQIGRVRPHVGPFLACDRDSSCLLADIGSALSESEGRILIGLA